MSKTYCSFPFTHQYIEASGAVRLCCATNDHVVNNKGHRFHMNNNSPESIWNSDYMKKIRLKMIKGERLKECTKCYEQEEAGIQSMRMTVNKTFFMEYTQADGTLSKLPNSMELHYGNICNLKCKMCSQNYSHIIGKELLEIGKTDKDFLDWVIKQSGNVNNWTNNLEVEYTWFKSERVKRKLNSYISKHIKLLTIIGGEPTIIPEFYGLLDYCDKEDTLKDKRITIVTNLTNTNPKMIHWLKRCRSWTIWASIDGLGPITEYIRYPSNFKKISENLEFYKKLALEYGNGIISFSPAIQLLNIHQLDDLLKWMIEYADGNFAGEGKNFVHISWRAVVWYPLICRSDIAPKDYKLPIADKLSKSVDYFKKYDGISKYYKGQIDNLRQEFFPQGKLNYLRRAFIRYNDKQHEHRGRTTWRQLLPELEKSLTKSIL
jgi:organic radical activating enzyme